MTLPFSPLRGTIERQIVLTLRDRVVMAIVTLICDDAPWPTGCERIHTLRDAMLWRIASLPGLDASVDPDGTVTVFRDRSATDNQ
jgi:hypothetical protein